MALNGEPVAVSDPHGAWIEFVGGVVAELEGRGGVGRMVRGE